MQKRYFMFSLMFFFLLTFSFQFVNAVEFREDIIVKLDNHTIQKYASVVHPYEEVVVKDKIADGYFYEFSVNYNVYPKLWNNQSPNLIQYCDMNITTQKYYSYLDKIGVTNAPKTFFYERYLEQDAYNQEVFISLSKGDSAFINLECYFTNSSLRSLDIPADFHISSPTYSCLQCQKYQWASLQPVLLKSEFLLQANTNNIDYIKKIVFINYEFVVIAYWFVLILAVVFSVGLIFLCVYWLYLWISKVSR